MDKILIVGQNPSRVNTPKCRTHIKLTEWRKQWNVDKFKFINCSDELGESGYTINYERLSRLGRKADKVVALGSVASKSLNKVHVAHFKMPHPSPRNRQLNDKSYELKMVDECKAYLQS